MIRPQFEEQVRLGLKSIVGAIVNDRGQIPPCLQNLGEMSGLGTR